MDSSLIRSNISRYVALDDREIEFLESILIPRPFKQGELIVKGGEQARYLMFVNSGYLMTYYSDKDGADHVIQFAAAGWWAGDIYSLSKEPYTLYTTKALCDGELLLLPRPAQHQLFENYNKFERYFRLVFKILLLSTNCVLLKAIHNQPNSATCYSRQPIPIWKNMWPKSI